MQAILAADPENVWAKEYIHDKSYYTDLKMDSTNYTIKKMAFSKGYGDFSPMLYGDNILFTSNRHNQAFVNRSFGWDQTFFVNKQSVFNRGRQGTPYYSFGPGTNINTSLTNFFDSNEDQQALIDGYGSYKK